MGLVTAPVNKNQPKKEVYQDKAGKWRWRITACNGQITCIGGQKFASKYSASRSVGKLIASIKQFL